MSTIDLHKKAFVESTLTKLEIFEDYTKEWLPTFIMSPFKEIWIFDFFAGTGYDKVNTAGSPIRILRQIKNQIGNIFNQKIKVNVCFNELDKEKFQQLQIACNQFLTDNPELNRAGIHIDCENKDFAKIFFEKLCVIKNYPSLVFLDQNGIKYLSDTYLLELEKTTKTDFLYYVSSSYVIRFGNTEEFKLHIDIDMDTIKSNPYKYIHKNILEELRTKLPVNTKLSLYPFTIKKGANVYGIIFGASHPRAVDKFLKTVWKKNAINGEANFDIDDDSSKGQLNIFEEKTLTKIEAFSLLLRENILTKKLTTNKDVYDFTLLHGHISNHAMDEIKKMKKEGLISYTENSPMINYEQVYQNKRIITFEIHTK